MANRFNSCIDDFNAAQNAINRLLRPNYSRTNEAIKVKRDSDGEDKSESGDAAHSFVQQQPNSFVCLDTNHAVIVSVMNGFKSKHCDLSSIVCS